MDPEEPEFRDGYKKFGKKVRQLEQRLSLVLHHALQNSQSPQAFYKVVELLGTMLDRPILKNEYNKCMPRLIQLMQNEVECANVSESIKCFLKKY